MSNVYPTAPGVLDFVTPRRSSNATLNPVRQGDTFRRLLTLQDFDLDGHDLRMEVKETKDATSSVLYLSTGNGRIFIDGDTITLEVTPTITAALEPATYFYDLEIITPQSEVYTLLEGRFEVVREITTQED